MSVSKLIVVLGATGNQGGSVVDAFLPQPGWQVRAITRDSSSARSKSLAGRGVEVVEANLNAPETLLSAFEGARAIFSKQRDGSVHFNSTLKPSQKLPFVAPEEDTGPIVKGLVEGEPGKHVIGYREFISQEELVDIFARVTGLESKLVTVPEYEFFAKMPPNLRVPLGESMAFIDEFGYTGGDPSVVSPKDIQPSPSLQSVADYLAKQPWAEVLASE
ncbi:nad -binding protein [Colletotrichum tabaci]|uniref:Nad -binding protein n=1 Tax=Colletotrichum tabaci TaxID=1209068 RepID=A0AAV9TLD6_9PEZI